MATGRCLVGRGRLSGGRFDLRGALCVHCVCTMCALRVHMHLCHAGTCVKGTRRRLRRPIFATAPLTMTTRTPATLTLQVRAGRGGGLRGQPRLLILGLRARHSRRAWPSPLLDAGHHGDTYRGGTYHAGTYHRAACFTYMAPHFLAILTMQVGIPPHDARAWRAGRAIASEGQAGLATVPSRQPPDRVRTHHRPRANMAAPAAKPKSVRNPTEAPDAAHLPQQKSRQQGWIRTLAVSTRLFA